jgi:putative methyltransferase (TIGR04325 family)
VYNSFREVPATGPGFAGDRWVDVSFKRLRELQRSSEAGIPSFNSSLLTVIAALINTQNRVVRVLDFGGGAALTYTELRKALGDRASVEYHIVESRRLVERARRELASDRSLIFHERLPDPLEDVDIVHGQSSLQYIENWSGVVQRLVSYSAEYIVLTDVPAGEFPSYVSAQTYYDSVIPHWFFNLDDVIAAVKRGPYDLVLKSRFLTRVLGVYGGYPQENFPDELRIGMPYNLLFKRRVAPADPETRR